MQAEKRARIGENTKAKRDKEVQIEKEGQIEREELQIEIRDRRECK